YLPHCRPFAVLSASSAHAAPFFLALLFYFSPPPASDSSEIGIQAIRHSYSE
ncbi:hypothetical protein MIMGU_mgv1a0267172mg, partial [Erythranthe guttata]